MLLFVSYLVLVIALPIALSVIAGFRALPRGSWCPNCAHETLPLLSRMLRLLSKTGSGLTLQKRWCPTCEWEGIVRIRATQHWPVTTLPEPAHYKQQLRTLELGGRPWHVMLESWRERGRYFGRLVFVGPSGRLWCDPRPAFAGPTHDEVLSQALALSDGLLTYRLREVIAG